MGIVQPFSCKMQLHVALNCVCMSSLGALNEFESNIYDHNLK